MQLLALTYPGCLSDDPVVVQCTNAQNLDRLVQYGIPALAVVVLLLAALLAMTLRRSL